MVLKNSFFTQLLRFGTIGSMAALVHLTVVMSLVEAQLLTPLTANVIAFSLAFQVSYWGNRSWTFHLTSAEHHVAIPRLFLVAGSGFIANEGLFYLFMRNFNLPYPIALILVLSILPIVTFSLSKFWIFR
jgi:putative flippase GtrA